MTKLPLPLTLLLWLVICGIVTFSIDRFAVSDFNVRVEDFRQPGMTDEQVIIAAAQAAEQGAYNWWWIRGRRPFLMFDANRDYNFDPIYYHARTRRNTYIISGHTVEFANHPK